ncbi:MAG: hypothetical protein ACJ75R_05630 [Solirubrobacterales bacterium]
MAIAVIQTFEATMDQYNAVNEKLGNDMPQGGVVHTAGVLPDGRIRVVDVWESQGDYESFLNDKLRPAIAEVAGDQAPTPEIEIYELHDLQVNG